MRKEESSITLKTYLILLDGCGDGIRTGMGERVNSRLLSLRFPWEHPDGSYIGR